MAAAAEKGPTGHRRWAGWRGRGRLTNLPDWSELLVEGGETKQMGSRAAQRRGGGGGEAEAEAVGGTS